MREISTWSGISSLVLASVFLFGSVAVSAQEKSYDEWEYEFLLNGWLPTIKPTLPTGETLNWSLSDLLSNLDMMLQLGWGAEKGKWSVDFDMLYLNLGKTSTIDGEIINKPVELEADLDLRALPITLSAGYQVNKSDKHRIEIIGGVRYIYIRVPITLSPNDTQKTVKPTPVVETWDGIVGLKGINKINDKWDFEYYADIGAGQSDSTYQAKLGFGYHFNKWTALFGYRHLRWNYDSTELLEDLTVSGPYIAAKWTF